MNPDIEQSEIESALATILSDDKFAAAPQMSAFLAYVVKQSLLGEADRIKAYTVAVDALGKPATFDPQNDPSVRVLAKRLRSSLEQYYERTSGHAVVIELKSGSYRPHFVRGFNHALSGDATTAQTADSVSADSDRPATAESDHQPVSAATVGAAALPVDSTDTAHAATSSPLAGTGTSGKAAPRWYGAVTRSPSPVLALITVAAVGWAANSHHTQIELRQDLAIAKAATASFDTTTDAGPIHIALASSSDPVSARVRPTIPTVFVPRSLQGDSLQARVANTMGSVMSRFDLIDVVRHRSVAAGGQWPEEYELSLNTLTVDQKTIVEIEVLQATTGRVAHVDKLQLAATSIDQLSGEDVAAIERMAARLANIDGPLMGDYRGQGDLTQTMNCLLTHGSSDVAAIAAGDAPDQGSPQGSIDTDAPECTQSVAGAVGNDIRPTVYQARALINHAESTSGPQRERQVTEALELANAAVEKAPYNAQAQMIMMQVLATKGALDDALSHGQRAVSLNPFDAATLRSVASLMDELGKGDEASDLRQRAQHFDPLAAQSI